MTSLEQPENMWDMRVTFDVSNDDRSREARLEQPKNMRYSLVLATSKRARQLIAGSKPLVEGAAGKKPLAIAIDELYKGKVKILPGKHEDEEEAAAAEETATETSKEENTASAEESLSEEA